MANSKKKRKPRFKKDDWYKWVPPRHLTSKVQRADDSQIIKSLPKNIGPKTWASVVEGNRIYLTRGRKVLSCLTVYPHNKQNIDFDAYLKWTTSFMNLINSKKKQIHWQKRSFKNLVQFFTCYQWFWEDEN